MPKKVRFLLNFCYFAVICGILWFFVRYLLRWLLPFLIALSFAMAAEPLILRCRRFVPIQRSFLSAVLTLTVSGLLCSGIVLLLRQLWLQTTSALESLPAYLEVLPLSADAILKRLESFCAACPAGIRQWVREGVNALAAQAQQRAVSLSGRMLKGITDGVALLPEIALFFGTTMLAVFFSVKSYPNIRHFLRRQLGERRYGQLKEIRESIRDTVGRWLRAQLILVSITFGELLVGFLLLRQPYPLLLGVLIALIDALPVLGTGTVLVPWGVLCCLSGNIPRGIALWALYALIALVRSILEPKIMASQADLPPLATLIAMYVGFHAVGVGGMILFPFFLLLGKQFYDRGLWQNLSR